jgi:two-component system, chemotaxis family, chemotaxis protein CheY
MKTKMENIWYFTLKLSNQSALPPWLSPLGGSKTPLTLVTPPFAKCISMAAGPRLEDLTILVIEDDGFTRSLILSILRGLGVKAVHEAAGAGTALEMLSANEIDVIVSDIEMEPVNGLDFLRHLRAGTRPAGVVPPRAPPSQTPVIFLTAHAKAKLVEQARAAGVSAFLTKPIRPALLRDRIMSAASQIRRAPSNAGPIKPASGAMELASETDLQRSTQGR